MFETDRRHFLKQLGAGASVLFLGDRLIAASSPEERLFTQFGVNAKMHQATMAKAAGADYLLLGVRSLLVPDESEAAFEKHLAALEQSALPVYSCNGFLKGKRLRCIGPEAKTDNVLRFAETTFRRARRAGVKHIVFGSSSSRSIPDKWSKEQADEQFIALLERMGPMAEAENVKVVVENLRSAECNYLNLASEVGAIVEQVNHPHVRVLADAYHSSYMNESPEGFAKYAHLTELIEIAERDGRTIPGVNGQDFTPYFSALKQAGFQGPIEIEGRWKPEQLPKAFATIREQASRV